MWRSFASTSLHISEMLRRGWLLCSRALLVKRLRNFSQISRSVKYSGWAGADALDTVEFKMALEEEWHFEIDDDFAQRSSDKTFRGLVEHVSN